MLKISPIIALLFQRHLSCSLKYNFLNLAYAVHFSKRLSQSLFFQMTFQTGWTKSLNGAMHVDFEK